MKMDGTSNMDDVVRQCQSCFGFRLPSVLWSNRVKKSLTLNTPPAGLALSVTVFNLYVFLLLFSSIYMSFMYLYIRF